jgi:hypothetical protein
MLDTEAAVLGRSMGWIFGDGCAGQLIVYTRGDKFHMMKSIIAKREIPMLHPW